MSGRENISRPHSTYARLLFYKSLPLSTGRARGEKREARSEIGDDDEENLLCASLIAR